MRKIYFIFLCLLSFVYAQNLDHDTIDLKETVLFDKAKFKLKRVGPDTKTKTILVGLKADLNMKNDSMPKIVEGLAVYINALKKEYTIKQLNFNFSNSIEDTLRLKVDLLSNINDKPNQSILSEPIYLNLTQKNQDVDQTYHLNLEYLNLKYKEEFYIYVELLNQKDKPIYFSGAMLNKCFFTTETNKLWQKTPLGISPAINADLLIKK